MNSTSSSCGSILQQVGLIHKLSPHLLKSLLPDICATISLNKNITEAEVIFRNKCCENQVAHTNNLDQEIVHEVCSYLLSINNRKEDDEIFFRENCHGVLPLLMNNTRVSTYPVILLYTLVSLLCTVGLFTNVLILYTLYQRKRYRNTMTSLISNLAIADILTIIEVICFLLYYKSQTSFTERTKSFLFSSIDIFVGSASLFYVTAISIERSVAVVYPLRHFSYVTPKIGRRIVKLIWACSFLLFTLAVQRIWVKNIVYEKVIFYVSVIFCFFIPCCLVVISYIAIIACAINTKTLTRGRVHVKNARYREFKIALNVTVIVVPFTLGWGFFTISNIYEVVNEMRFKGYIDLFILLLPLLISCLNPLTYLIVTSSLRHNVWLLIKKILQDYGCCKECAKVNSPALSGDGSCSKHTLKDTLGRNSSTNPEDILKLRQKLNIVGTTDDNQNRKLTRSMTVG